MYKYLTGGRLVLWCTPSGYSSSTVHSSSPLACCCCPSPANISSPQMSHILTTHHTISFIIWKGRTGALHFQLENPTEMDFKDFAELAWLFCPSFLESSELRPSAPALSESTRTLCTVATVQVQYFLFSFLLAPSPYPFSRAEDRISDIIVSTRAPPARVVCVFHHPLPHTLFVVFFTSKQATSRTTQTHHAHTKKGCSR